MVKDRQELSKYWWKPQYHLKNLIPVGIAMIIVADWLSIKHEKVLKLTNW